MSRRNQPRKKVPILIWVALIGLIGALYTGTMTFFGQRSSTSQMTTSKNAVDTSKAVSTPQVQQINRSGDNQNGLINIKKEEK